MGAYLGIAAAAEQKKKRKKKSRSVKENTVANTVVTGAATEITTTDVKDIGVSQTVTQGPPTGAVQKKYDQCGLEDDSDEWTDWEGPQRIKTCQLSEDDQAKFRGIVDKIFSREITVLSVRAAFKPEDVIEVIDKVRPYLESEPMLIEDAPLNISVVGDLHGQLYDLARVFKGDDKDGKPGYYCRKYIFLGNYVDKGRQSLEIVMALCCLKMLRPDDIFLLRGNHEFVNVNADKGFWEEMEERYEPALARMLYLHINETFCYLSVAAILGDVYFCSHGGIAAAGLTRRALKSILKPISRSDEDILIHDLVWADPAERFVGSMFNIHRATSNMFGANEMAHAHDALEVKASFRGHTMHKEGYKMYWHMCCSVYSASDCQAMNNRGSVAELDEKGQLSMRILEVCEKRKAWEKAIRELEGKPPYAVKEKKKSKTEKIVKNKA